MGVSECHSSTRGLNEWTWSGNAPLGHTSDKVEVTHWILKAQNGPEFMDTD